MRVSRSLVAAALALGAFAAAGCGSSDKEEIRAVVKELQRAGSSKAHGTRVCAVLTARAQAQMTTFLGGFTGGEGCAEVLGKAQPDPDVVTSGDVAKATVTVRGDRALMHFAGADDEPIGLARVDGEWRIDNILNPTLAEEPPRRVDPRLSKGTAEQQVLATYRAAGAAIAARDTERACALFSHGAEAQVVVARLFANLAGGRPQSGKPDFSCPAALKAVLRLGGSGGAFTGAVPTAAQLATAKVAVHGQTATVTITGRDAGHFIHEEGRWLVAPDPETVSLEDAPTAATLERCWRRAGTTIARSADDLRFARADAVRGITVAPGRTSVKGDDWRIFYAHAAGDEDPGIGRVLARPSFFPVVVYVRDASRHADVVARARDCGH
jgi:transposase